MELPTRWAARALSAGLEVRVIAFTRFVLQGMVQELLSSVVFEATHSPVTIIRLIVALEAFLHTVIPLESAGGTRPPPLRDVVAVKTQRLAQFALVFIERGARSSFIQEDHRETQLLVLLIAVERGHRTDDKEF